MSAAATTVVSSADVAGDMPSSVPTVGGDSSQDGAQPFSEVLSLSTPDHAGSTDSAPRIRAFTETRRGARREHYRRADRP